MIFRLNFALDSAVRTEGRTAGIVDDRVEVAVPVDDRVDHRLDRVVVADIAGVEFVRQPVDLTPGAGDNGGTLRGEDGADAGADPSNAAGNKHDPAGEPEAESRAFVGVGHCASVPSKCLLR